jgi:hypothetical protein
VGLDICGKPRFPTGFDLPNVQHVASHYTAYAIPVHTLCGTFTIYDVYGADSPFNFRLPGRFHDACIINFVHISQTNLILFSLWLITLNVTGFLDVFDQ